MQIIKRVSDSHSLSHTFGAVYLVAGERRQVDSKAVHVHGQLPRHLREVAVQEDLGRAADLTVMAMVMMVMMMG